MTIEVRAPNGDIVQFPDGTPDTVMANAMRQAYGGPSGEGATAGKPGAVPTAADMPALPGFKPMQTATTPTGEFQVQQPTPGGAEALPGQGTRGPNVEDIITSFGTGVGNTVTSIPGIPGSLEWAARRGMDVTNWAAGTPTNYAETTLLPTMSDARRALVPEYTPQTTEGKYARALGEFAPAVAMPTNAPTLAGNVVQRALLNTTLPALASEAAGQHFAGTPYEGPARVGAALLAPYAPRTAMRLATPLPASAPRTAAAEALGNEGVDLTAGQRTGNRLLRYAESAATETPLAGPNVADITERQGGQFTRAAMRRVDEAGNTIGPDELATPEWLRGARARIGGEFDRLAAGNDIDFRGRAGRARGTALTNETLRLEAEYNALVPDALQRNPLVEDLVDDVNNAIANGRLDGASYQAWRSRFSRAAAQYASDPEFGRFMGGMRNALDNAMESGLSGADQAAWQRARREWAHLLTLENAAASAGADAALGVVSPQQLAMASRSGRRELYSEGRAPFSDLAHAGSAVMERLPNSGTPARLNVTSLSLPGLLMGGTVGRAVGSPGAQWYLGRQDLAPALNALGRTQPNMVARALMLPVEMSDTLTGR